MTAPQARDRAAATRGAARRRPGRAARMRGAVFTLLLGLLAAGAIGASLVWRVPDQPMETLVTRYGLPPSRFMPIDGVTAHVRVQGPADDPLPIVLVHGTSASLHTWDGWAQALSPTRRVITMDLPGFGLTGPRADGDYSMQMYARFVATLLDALGVRRAVIGGNSLGGQIAWYFASVHPDRVDRLVLVDAAGYPLTSQDVPIAFRLARTPLARQAVRDLLPRSLVAASVRNVYGDPSRVDEALIDRYYDLATRAGNREALSQRFEEVAREFADPSLPARIATLKMPVLILWGGRDRLIPPEYAQRFLRDLPQARLVSFDALGHVPHEEDPAATVAPVLEFVRR